LGKTVDSATWNLTDSVRIRCVLSDGRSVYDGKVGFKTHHAPSIEVSGDLGASLEVDGLDTAGSLVWTGKGLVPSGSDPVVLTIVADRPTSDQGYLGTVRPVNFSMDSGTYDHRLTVLLSSPTPLAEIHYTFDGTLPTKSSPLYQGGVILDTSTLVRARAFLDGMYPSLGSASRYTLACGPVTLFSLGTRTLGAVMVRLQTKTPDGTIRYELGGRRPSVESKPFLDSLLVMTPDTLRARVFSRGKEPGPEFVQVFGRDASILTTDRDSGVFYDTLRIHISGLLSGDVVHCRRDGIDPSLQDSVCSTTILLDTSMQFRARAFSPGGKPGPLLARHWTLQVGKLSLTGAKDTSDAPLALGARTVTPGATIRYATPGQELSKSSPVVPVPLDLDSASTLKFQAYRKGFQPSEILTRKFFFAVDTIEWGRPPGSLLDQGTVAPRSKTSGAVLRCATNGGSADSLSPVCQNSYVIDSAHPTLRLAVYASYPGHPGILPARTAPGAWNWRSSVLHDLRDGKTYGLVEIGQRIWMSQNLDYDTADGTDSWCYLGDTSECRANGRLYSARASLAFPNASEPFWKLVSPRRGICPEGSRIPADDDIKLLAETWDYNRKVRGFGSEELRRAGTFNMGSGTYSTTRDYSAFWDMEQGEASVWLAGEFGTVIHHGIVYRGQDAVSVRCIVD